MKVNPATLRRGYTLSEVLLVLGVIATVAALAQPALRSSLGDSRLRSAARQIRTELAKTRLRAMQSGTAHRFRYQVEKNCFEIAPAEYDEHDESASPAAVENDWAEVASKTESDSETPKADNEAVVHELPEGVLFEPVEEVRTAAVDEQGWSQPIVFYPNGRAADAKIRLRGERDAVVDVSLRGLTGVATASRPRHQKISP
jgi:prepilin-type N-terminal cleavage/methylation domain-containing protein